MKITADKNTDGSYIPSTLKISFKSMELNKKLCKYLEAKDIQCAAKDHCKNNAMTNTEKIEMDNLEKTLDEIKQSLIDSNLVIRKGTSDITVKIPQFDFSPQDLANLNSIK